MPDWETIESFPAVFNAGYSALVARPRARHSWWQVVAQERDQKLSARSCSAARHAMTE
jgi:hypothetical protein